MTKKVNLFVVELGLIIRIHQSKFVSVEVFKLTPNVTDQHLH